MTWLGDARYRVQLQAPTGTSGYTVQARDWASIRMASGSEAFRFGGALATGNYTLTIRYRDDVKAEWRVVVPADNRTFQITSYGDPDGKRRWLKMFCTEVQ